MSRLQTSLNTPILASGTFGNSVVLGEGAVSSNNTSTAVGYFASASGDSSTAIGKTSSATGASSLALGGSASATNLNSIAIGSDTSSSGSASIAIGIGSTSSAVNSIIIGSGVTNNVAGSMLLGGSAGLQDLTLIWNDHTADLGTLSDPFGTLYVNNAAQLAPPSVTAYTVALGPQTVSTPLSLITGSGGGMSTSPNPGSYFTLDNTDPTTPKLKYTGTVARYFDISFMITYTGLGLSESVSLYLVVNSTSSPPSPIGVICGFNGGSTAIRTNHSLREIIQLNQNDYIWFAMQTNQFGTYTFGPCSITATQI